MGSGEGYAGPLPNPNYIDLEGMCRRFGRVDEFRSKNSLNSRKIGTFSASIVNEPSRH